MSIFRILLTSATALLIAAVPEAQASSNVVPNPGFEQGGCGNTPVLCGWSTYQFMSQDTTDPHSGGASMSLGGINAFSVVAWTDPAACAAIGAGSHLASFWYRSTSDSVYLAASFYQAADCTGPSADEFLCCPAAGGDAWQEASGTLVAPAGTQSALFAIGVNDSCDVGCTDPVFGNFDDIDVEGAIATLPSISSFSPTSGPVGTSVDIQGTSFIGATSVTFNGTADPSFVVNSPTGITAHVPAGATTGPISVTTPSGTATSPGSFTVTPPPPTIGSFTPTSGPVGTSVDIQGTSFIGATSVTFNGTADPSFVVNSPTDITAHVPTAARTGSISVITPGGTSTSAGSFTVTVPPPKISGFSPTSGHAGQQVTITGSNLTGATSVKLGATSAKFTVGSSTRIIATVPAISRGYYRWSVTSPGGTTTSTALFHVL